MTVKETLDVISEMVDCQILYGFTFTTVKYLHTDENNVILSDLVTGVRDWVNIVPGTFGNFIENFQKLDWKDIFIFI